MTTKIAVQRVAARQTAKGGEKPASPSPLPFYHFEGSITMRITEVLKHGRENATRADVLAAKLETTPRACAA